MATIEEMVIEHFRRQGGFSRFGSHDLEPLRDVFRTVPAPPGSIEIPHLDVLRPGDHKAAELVNVATLYGQMLAAQLYGIKGNESEIDVVDFSMLLTGRTNPIKYRIARNDIPTTSTFYVKPFCEARILGLELYSRLFNVGQDYNFFLTEHDVVEDSLEGRHANDIPADELAEIKDKPLYRRKRIEGDVVLFSLGFQDVFETPDGVYQGREANYLIKPDGSMRIIDFDAHLGAHTHPQYRPDAVECRKDNTCEELGIDRETYDSIYAALEEKMVRNYLTHRVSIQPLLELYTPSTGIDGASIINRLNMLVLQHTGVRL